MGMEIGLNMKNLLISVTAKQKSEENPFHFGIDFHV